eukprot:scaffold25496_cov130-Isochrysis_galbana.AAC.13
MHSCGTGCRCRVRAPVLIIDLPTIVHMPLLPQICGVIRSPTDSRTTALGPYRTCRAGALRGLACAFLFVVGAWRQRMPSGTSG